MRSYVQCRGLRKQKLWNVLLAPCNALQNQDGHANKRGLFLERMSHACIALARITFQTENLKFLPNSLIKSLENCKFQNVL
jgi:hypothetical protein